MPTLTIQLPGLPPVSHVLREETTTIGRMKGSTIVLDDNSVSLMHAKITRGKEGEYFLKDLNSTNGTLLNGQVVREVRLQDLDQICFADVIAQFHSDVPASVQPIVPMMPPPSVGAQAPKPARASQPIATSDTSRHRRSSSSSSGSGVTRLANQAVPILVGIAALLIVGILVWKFFISKHDSNDVVAVTPAVEITKPKQPKAEDKANRPNPVEAAVAKSKNPGAAPKAAKTENAGVARLVIGLKDADVEERRRAARALHSMGAEAKDAEVPLREALKDTDEEVQMWAALTLVNNKSYDKPSIPILVRTLKHENASLRQVACLSLTIIPYEAAEKEMVIPALATAAANDDDEEVRKAAYSALQFIAPDIVARANEK